MPAAPFPIDELDRKQVLDSLGVLDSAAESFSDALAIAAAALAKVPISAISLVDTDRQWFKAACGLAVQETPRDISFCAYAILQTEPFIVSDAAADARFADNALVTGPPFIRFYAGFPLSVRGEHVGALCVIDTQPRFLTPEVVDHLTVLAAGTSDWLGDRRALLGLLKRSEDELHRSRSYDRVTGLPNRRIFDEVIGQHLKQSEASGESLAVLFVDLDGFKERQALWGHVGANEAIKEVGKRLRASAKSTDLVAHLGVDQFLILATGNGAESAGKLAQKLGAAVNQPMKVLHHSIRFTTSIGVALHPADGPVEQLVENANSAMVSVRRAGGNGFGFFTVELTAQAQQQMELVEALRLAVERNELTLHYQPKVDANSGQMTGAEALLRWIRPGRPVVGPDIFVPLAESAGFINELGSWVIAAACRQMGIWCNAGLRMRVSINISVHQLRLPHLGEEISTQLTRHGVDPSLLTCEITESVAMDDATTSLATFNRLRAHGVRLSIDDFGTGYSSLSYLTKLPVSQLKIDRSFVSDLTTDEATQAVVASIIHLAHALQLEVVAEGVETAEQRDMLLGLGCDAFQGYFFARPMSAARFTDLASKGQPRDSGFRPSIYATL